MSAKMYWEIKKKEFKTLNHNSRNTEMKLNIHDISGEAGNITLTVYAWKHSKRLKYYGKLWNRGKRSKELNPLSPSPSLAGTHKHKYRNTNRRLFFPSTQSPILSPTALPFSLLLVHVDSYTEFQYTVWNANELGGYHTTCQTRIKK